MTLEKCCRTCKHCVAVQQNLLMQCRLRTITIHSEISSFAFCHHWMRKSPILPKPEKQNETYIDQQLDFGKVLVPSDK